jgi:hypothetical protein
VFGFFAGVTPSLIVIALSIGPTLCAQQLQEDPSDSALTKPPLGRTDRNLDFMSTLLTIQNRDTIALWVPVVKLGYGNLRLEARYQWEGWRTASLWAGHHFGFGKALKVDLTPMAGVVFGNINGVAPGFRFQTSWRSLYFTSASLLFIDLQNDTRGFTFTWNELMVDLDVVVVGVVAQRSRTFISPLDLQRGLLLRREQGAFTFSMYLFNLLLTDPTLAFALTYGFGTAPERTPYSAP